MIEVMVRHLKNTDTQINHTLFVLPWFYALHEFETDSENMTNTWNKESIKENEI